jgi:hypothetical protein
VKQMQSDWMSSGQVAYAHTGPGKRAADTALSSFAESKLRANLAEHAASFLAERSTARSG